MSTFTLAISFDHFQFALIHGPGIPGSYAILLFTASDLASITRERGCGPVTGKDRASCQSGGAPALRPGARAQSPDREAALAWASLAQRFPASSVLAREGAGCGSVRDVPGAWLASAPLWPSLWTQSKDFSILALLTFELDNPLL